MPVAKDVYLGSELIGTIEAGCFGKHRRSRACTIDGKVSLERTARDAHDFLVAQAGARAARQIAVEDAAKASLADATTADLMAELLVRAKEGKGENETWKTHLLAVMYYCETSVQSAVAVEFVGNLDDAQASKALDAINECAPEAVAAFVADLEDAQSIVEKAREVVDVLRNGGYADQLAIARELGALALS